MIEFVKAVNSLIQFCIYLDPFTLDLLHELSKIVCSSCDLFKLSRDLLAALERPLYLVRVAHDLLT